MGILIRNECKVVEDSWRKFGRSSVDILYEDSLARYVW